MILGTKDGICCDHCGSIEQRNFTYYSWDLHERRCREGRLGRQSQNVVASFDICQNCQTAFEQRIVKAFKPTRITPDKRCPTGLNCDITGEQLRGDFKFYQCIVTKLSVQFTQTTPRCKVCNIPVNTTECPQCKGTELIKRASTVPDKDYLELWLSTNFVAALQERASKIGVRSEAAQWTTKE
jgi:hypothetical protein